MKDINKNNIELFFEIEINKEMEYINSLVGKYVLLEISDESFEVVDIAPAKLISFNNNILELSVYDDGTKDTTELWTEKTSGDLFEDWKIKVPLEQIKWIHEYKDLLNELKINDGLINKKIKLTNTNNLELAVKLIEYDKYTIMFEVEFNKESFHLYYPIVLIKKIEVID